MIIKPSHVQKNPSAYYTGRTQVTLHTNKHLLDFIIVLVHKLEMLYKCSVKQRRWLDCMVAQIFSLTPMPCL